jgi:hypothetical protein
MALISLEDATGHLRIDLITDGGSPSLITDERYADLNSKILQAEAIVLDYLKNQDTGWDISTVPFHIKAAVLLVLSALWEDREGTGEGDYLAEDGAVARLLRRSRDPAYA